MEEKKDVLPIFIKNDDKCYVCGRKAEDLKKMYDEIINESTAKIKETQDKLNIEIDNSKKYIESILKDTEGNPYMIVDYTTIRRNQEKYSKLIPHLDFLLKYYYENNPNMYGLYNTQNYPNITLSDIIKFVKEDSDKTGSDEIEELREYLDRQIEYKKKIEAVADRFWTLGNYEIIEKVIVPLCYVCQDMFHRASKSASLSFDDD